MRPILYDATETAFDTNGIGALSDAISCVAGQGLNGQYELTLKYPVKGIHFADIAQRSIILAKPDPGTDPQPFRVYRITKPTLTGIVTVYARHIAYDLIGVPAAPFSAASVSDAFVTMKNNAVTDCPFTFYTDKSTAANMTVSVPTPIWTLLGGSEGSILDTYGGEYEFDRWNVNLLNRRGADRGVTIRYGKNLTTLEQDENCANCYTGVYPYWTNTDGTGLVELPEKIINAAGTYNYVRILTLDLSEEWEEAPTEEQLRSRAQSYMTANDIGVPTVSWKIEFVQLEQTDEYKGLGWLEQVLLGDTVSVYFPDMGIEASARVVEAEFDSILERYNSVTLGSVKANLAQTIATQSKEIAKKPSISMAERISAQLAGAILGAKGGAVRQLDTDGDGLPDTIYVADNPDPALAVKVWRWNYEGWAASKTGYSGPFALGATLEDGLLANAVTAANLVAGTIKSADDGKTFFLDLDNGILKMQAAELSIVGEDGSETSVATSDSTITSTVEEFYRSTSPTDLSGGSWSTDAPAWKNGYYIWRRTLVTYGDGTTEYTPSEKGVCITGNNGADGTSGVGVSGIVNYYLASASATGVTVSASGWTEAVQAVSASKKYLWNYEAVTYTNGTTQNTDPCVIGVYAADGANGKGISSIAEYYARSTSNSTAPSSWQTTVPTLTATYKYLWNYEVITYTDNTTYTSTKRVIGVYGDTGANGVGVESIETQYAVSPSSIGISSSDWSTSVPTIPEGQYLWTRTVITYTSGSVVVDGVYCLSKAMEDVVDDMLTQQEVFNRLTDNGKTQGIYLKNGKLYINMEYAQTGSLISDYISLKGLFAAYAKSGKLGGYLGYGEGSTDKALTDGIALYNSDYSCYVIVTDKGTRMQAGSTSFYITKDMPSLIADLGNGGEYVNPPMNVGAEYATVYRYRGKQVYAKLVSLGTMPTAAKTFYVEGVTSYGITPVSISLQFAHSNGMSYAGVYPEIGGYWLASGGYIGIQVDAGFESGVTGYALITYAK